MQSQFLNHNFYTEERGFAMGAISNDFFKMERFVMSFFAMIANCLHCKSFLLQIVSYSLENSQLSQSIVNRPYCKEDIATSPLQNVYCESFLLQIALLFCIRNYPN